MCVVTLHALNRAPTASGGCQSPGNDTASARVCQALNSDPGIALVFAMANVRRGDDLTGRLTSTARPGRDSANVRRDGTRVESRSHGERGMSIPR
jgi:hypothetical protein